MLWGTGGVFGKALGDHADLHALSVAMLRLAVGGLALVVWLVAMRRFPLRSVTREGWRRIVAMGIFTAAFEAAYFTAINLTSVGFATLVAIGSTPVMVAIYAAIRERQRPELPLVGALSIALVGLVLLLGRSADTGSDPVRGSILALVTGAAFAAITIINKVPVPGLPPAMLTGTAFTFGGIVLVPFALSGGFGVPTDATSWGLLFALGLGATALAYVFFLSGLRTVTPTVATVVTLIEPLIAAILGWIVFSEWLGAWGIVGGVLLGVAVVILRPERDEPH